MQQGARMTALIFVALFTVNGIKALSPVMDWKGLKVNYGLQENLPRTRSEAISDGYVQISDQCLSHQSFRGFQFIKNNDSTVRLLYDVSGYIAGIQMAAHKNLRTGYPALGTDTGFVDFDELFVTVTVYFVDPAIICRRGRSEQQFQSQGTASGVYIQYGNNPETDIFEVPYYANHSSWTEGLCFPGMGLHHYKIANKDMSCDQLYPIALLYYNNVLTGFIFMFSAKLNSSSVVLEYPPKASFQYIIKDVPSCFMAEDFVGTSLHVFLQENPSRFTCKPVKTAASTVEEKCTSGTDRIQPNALIMLFLTVGFHLNTNFIRRILAE